MTFKHSLQPSGSTTTLQNASQATVSVHALSCGHFTLPEYQFIHPISRDVRKNVPSLAFLIQHNDQTTGRLTRIVFDLGLRRDTKRYAAPIQEHIKTRQPMTTDPDVTKNLARGGLRPVDVDFVIYSHVSVVQTLTEALVKTFLFQVHWDHIGEPRDFLESTFVVGHGSLALLNGTSSSLRGGHSFFEHDLLPEGRTVELTDPSGAAAERGDVKPMPGVVNLKGPWLAHGRLPQTLDIFSDGSLLIVNAPGHLPGHINLLARTTDGHQVYLAGDACHDKRLLTGEKSIGEWADAHGHTCCIHANRKEAEETIQRIRQLESDGVEIIFAHDVDWERDPVNSTRFFGAS